MPTVNALLLGLALIFEIASIMGKLPLWPAVLCIIIERGVSLGWRVGS